jgi:hypothetical protein
MNRGSTLIEMTVMLFIAGLICASAYEGLVRLRRLAAVDPLVGTRAEQACALLRRDLAGGQARRAGAELHVPAGAGRPAVVWQVEDGQLLRDGRLQVAVSAFSVEEADGVVAVMLTPSGLSGRRIEGLR